MLVNNANILDKKYKKLTIQVGMNGFSFCCSDTLNNSLFYFKEIKFETIVSAENVKDLFANAFKENEELNATYDEIVVLHDNNLSTFVPTALFDMQFLGSYLQYNNKVFETDYFAFDVLPSYQINTVYIPFVNINNIFIDVFGTFLYKHVHTILVGKLLDLSKNIDEKKMFVHMSSGHFEIIVVQNQKLLLFNSFEYKTPEDLIYYLLFTAEQLNLNPELFQLEFLGNSTEEDDYFKIAYRYIRNVSLFDMSDLEPKNPFSTEDNLKHFTLFQS